MPNMDCPICHGEGWVCEDHPDRAWGYGSGCCGGAGIPCACNPHARVDFVEVFASTDDDHRGE